MKRIQSKAGLLKRRVNEVHSRAKSVGIIYLFATIGLFVAALLLPIMNGIALYCCGQKPMNGAYEGLRNLLNMGLGAIFQTPAYIIALLQYVLYFVLLLILFINVLRAFGKLNWLFKKKASYVNGFNRNMYAMDALGKRYASSFAALAVFYLLFALLTLGDATPTFTLVGYIVLGVALLIRFAIGALEGKVPLFTTGGKIIEQKRDHGVLVYFIRNFVQVAILAGVLYFFMKASVFAGGLENMLTQIMVEKNKMYIINVNALPVYVELFAFIFLTVMIKHATASTEYSRTCNHTTGMKNFSVFACALTIMFAAEIVFPYIGIGLAEGATPALNMPMLWAAVIAFVGFLFDCIVKARDEKRVEEETDEDPVPADEEEEKQAIAYGLPIQPQMPYPYAMAESVEGKTYQPIFVPVFCAFPQSGTMPAPFTPVAPSPAPQNLLPSPSPMTAAAEAEEQEKEETERTVEDFEMNPHRKYKVYCPQCGKVLMARDSSPYHRCPACDKVFQLRKFKTYVKSE